MDAVDIDPEVRIGEPAVSQTRGVGEKEVDQKGSDGENDWETELAEAIVDITAGDDVIVVAIKELNVLLKGGGRCWRRGW